MFRFLFFIFVITLIVYGFFNGFTKLNIGSKTQISTDYKQVLDEALAKHIPERKKYEVVFFRGEFTGETFPSDTQKNSSFRDSYFSESIFNQRAIGNLPSYQDFKGGSTLVSSGYSTLSAGKKGKNSYSQSSGGSNIFSEECHGIIFDPCIPEVDYGAPRRELIFEKAPIAYYTGPGELPF